MPGASSSAVHGLVVEDDSDHVLELVLRRFDDAAWLAREPDLPAREAEALTLLEATTLATPRLIAVDATAEHCDVPAVLMTRLPGRPSATPDDVDVFVRRLAEPLPLVHETPVPATAVIPAYRPYDLDAARRGELHPPSGSGTPMVWERAIEVHAAARPARERAVFLHRDYHPGNVLWRRGQVTGVVDWVNVCRGPVDADLGHCRYNLTLGFDLEVADRFLAAHRALTGERDYDPYWDIVAAVGMLPEFEEREEAAEEFVARAVEEHGNG